MSERLIFRFDDNGQPKALDPLLVWERFWSDAQVDDIWLALKRLKEGDAAGFIEVADVFSRAAKLPTVEDDPDHGWTRLDLVELFIQFTEFVEEVKKKHGPLPTPSRLMVLGLSERSSTTKPAADSSGTPIESTQDVPIGPGVP